MSISYPINDKLFLINQAISTKAKKAAKPVAAHQNLVFVLDVSYSMVGDLPKMREQLKNRMTSLLKPGDTITIDWFSSRGQFGSVLEFQGVKDLADIKRIHDVIDRWIRPVGATGFKEPIELVAKQAEKFDNGNPWNMIFMTDGGENQWPRNEVLNAIEATGKKIASVTIVEYGYYADRSFLASLAAKVGGRHIFAVDFDAFEPVMAAAFSAAPVSDKKIDVKLEGDHIGGFAWTVNDKEIVAYAIEGNKVTVPESTERVFYLAAAFATSARGVSNTADKGWVRDAQMRPDEDPALDGLYSGISLFAVRVQPEIVLGMLKVSGDVRLIEQFANCFGKQKYTEFQEATQLATFDRTQRWVNGYNPDRVPAEDAWTVLDTLELLASAEENRVLLDSKEFKYARIGRAREANEDALKFVPNMLGGVGGYSVDNLVFNGERPNVSIQVRKNGTVDLSKEDNIPESVSAAGQIHTFPTQVIRNYAIIKDGLVNVDRLPVLLVPSAAEKLESVGVIERRVRSTQRINDVEVEEYVLDLKKMPVINRKMVKELNAESFISTHLDMERAAAAAKVAGDYYKNLVVAKQGFTRTSEGLAKKYGEMAAAWLKERGLTDHGFSPRGKTAESSDYYMGKELKVALKGLSSLPPVKDAKDKLAKWNDEKLSKGDKAKAPPIAVRLMEEPINSIEQFLEANKGRDEVISRFLDGLQVTYRTAKRKLAAKASRDLICVILGQNWFGRTTLDPIHVSLNTSQGKVDATIDQREVEIHI